MCKSLVGDKGYESRERQWETGQAVVDEPNMDIINSMRDLANQFVVKA